MIIDVYTYLRNEETILPYWLRHYKQFARRITIFDNESDDRTREIALAAGAVVIPVLTGGKHVVPIQRRIMSEEYKKSRGEADWVICAEGDEFFWHPNLIELLKCYKKEGVTFPKIQGYDMVSEAPPAGAGHVYEEIKHGFPNGRYFNKRGVFHPSIDINFEPGGHECDPVGKVVESPDAEIKLLHYRYLGEEYFVKRYEAHRSRMSDENRKGEWGIECLQDHRERFRNEMENAKPHLIQVVP